MLSAWLSCSFIFKLLGYMAVLLLICLAVLLPSYLASWLSRFLDTLLTGYCPAILLQASFFAKANKLIAF
jgi:hypothetical protein